MTDADILARARVAIARQLAPVLAVTEIVPSDGCAEELLEDQPVLSAACHRIASSLAARRLLAAGPPPPPVNARVSLNLPVVRAGVFDSERMVDLPAFRTGSVALSEGTLSMYGLPMRFPIEHAPEIAAALLALFHDAQPTDSKETPA